MDRTSFENAWRATERGCTYHAVGSVGIYTLPAFSRLPFVSHGFSARTGGVSAGCFSSLNLSFTRPEQRENVLANYRIFCAAAGIPEESMVMDSYEHGTSVLRVDGTDCGRGYTREPLPPCDGLVTNDPSVTLITGHADCMAFYMADPKKRAIGLAHAGWRGALGRIGRELALVMRRAFGSEPNDLIAGVGPSICPNCFEVGADVAADFAAAFPAAPLVSPGRPGKATVNLWMAAVYQFMEGGVRPENICLSEACTFEDERLYSHRRDKGQTGGMAAFLRIV